MIENGKQTSSSLDPGLATLVMLLRFQGVGVDPAQIRHQFGATPIGVAEMLRCGRALPVTHWLDTLVLARRSFAFPSYSLDSLCVQLKIDRGRAHRADSDVAAMRALFAKVVATLAPASVRDLWEVRIAERRARTAIVEACEAAAEAGLPVQIVYRPSRKGPQTMLMVLTEVRSDLDLPKAIGYLLPGRGRRELRADRILRVEPPPSDRSP